MVLAAPKDRLGFEVAIFCALKLEADAVLVALDNIWDGPYGQAPGDDNAYTLGSVGEHNVVVVHMAGMGSVNAATTAASLRSSFPHVKLALIVGVCGAVPESSHHKQGIFLGDIVISTAIIQYDFGRQYPTVFQRKDMLEDSSGRPSHRIRAMLAKLETRHYSRKLQDEIMTLVQELQQNNHHIHIDPGQDHLYDASYLHKHQGQDCKVCSNDPFLGCEAAKKLSCEKLHCDPNRRVSRTRLALLSPTVTILPGSTLADLGPVTPS